MMQSDSAMIASILRSTPGKPPFPVRAERQVWEQLRGQPLAEQITAQALHALKEPIPLIPATAYLAFYRDGQREPYERPARRRRERLMLMTLAECLEAQGRFADAILDQAWAICEESTWVASAHSWDYPHNLPDPNVPLIDLLSARTALTLAEVDHLLDDLLHPALRARIRHEVDRRSTSAFLARDDYWWLGNGPRQINNWTAVCVGATAGAALYLEPDEERLAAILAKGMVSLQRYLATFGADGACNEGVGYWEFGFGYYVLLADLLAARTAGQIDLLDHPHVRQIAAFPAKVELSPGKFVAFSDVGLELKPQPALLHFLARRFDLPELAALDHTGPLARVLTKRGPSEQLRDLFWYPADVQIPQLQPPPSSYLPDVQWLIVRAEPADPDGLVLAAKAGHNAESHNQNDVGSFMVHWRQESLVAELGAGRYTRDYFRPDLRYTFFPNASRGHSVPLVNGCEQRAGAEFRAKEVRYFSSADEEALEMDLAEAYPPEAGLHSLQRRVALRRSGRPGVVVLTDTVKFADVPGTFESALISFGKAVEQAPGQLVLAGQQGSLAVHYDAAQLRLRIDVVPEVDLRGGLTTVTRVAFVVRAPVRELRVELRLIPIDGL